MCCLKGCSLKKLKRLMSICWSVNWSVGWFVGWMVGRFVGWLVGLSLFYQGKLHFHRSYRSTSFTFKLKRSVPSIWVNIGHMTLDVFSWTDPLIINKFWHKHVLLILIHVSILHNSPNLNPIHVDGIVNILRNRSWDSTPFIYQQG